MRLTSKNMNLSGDEEFHSLVEETLGATRSENTSYKIDIPQRRFWGSTLWQVLGLVFFGIVVLFTSDSFEFKIVSGGQSDMDAIPGHVISKQTRSPGQNINGNGNITNDSVPFESPEITEPDTSYPISEEISQPVSSKPVHSDDLGSPEPLDTKTGTTEVSSDSIGEETSRSSYYRRGQPITEQEREAMVQNWGSWTLIDEKKRPTRDIYAKYPNRDIPRSEFPTNAWQIDKAYLKEFLPEAIALVQRAQEAIMAEYGHTEGTWEERSKMFELDFYNGTLGEVVFPKEFNGDKGGWTTSRSWEGLKRRILHAIMTEDIFVFAMGGHSAAAGHGNHFQQSYTLQVQWILEAVFARLGVRHQSRNFGNGGLGTAHNGIASGSIYGPDVDFLMWDSGMTEREPEALDAFARQALLGGGKVPVLWSLFPIVAAPLHDQADVDVGCAGTGYSGIPELTKAEDVETMPWASRYVRCVGDLFGLCRENEYIGNCWWDRDDFTPSTKQNTPPGRAKWHPGNRKHQVTGRILAFTLLSALGEVLNMWNNSDGYEIGDETWHVTAYYDNIRRKLLALGPDVGFCNKYAEKDLDFICKYPMKSRTEFTPRAFPSLSNIRSLIPDAQKAYINEADSNAYAPPDIFNPNLHPPPGEIDVLNILENGVDFNSLLNPDYTRFYKKPSFSSPSQIPIGKGISLTTKAGDDFCDGSVDSFCDRGASNGCLLYGHNDGRNGLLFDGLSGWVVMNLPDVKNGFIVVKMETWHLPGENKATNGWTSVNNEASRLLSINSHNYHQSSNVTRNLKVEPDPFCDEFHFEYAIDGKIESLNLTQFESKRMMVQRVVETVTLLRDPDYTGGVEKEVEVAVRIIGCERVKTFLLSHIYWS